MSCCSNYASAERRGLILEKVDCSPALDRYIEVFMGDDQIERLYLDYCPFCGAEL